MLTETGKLTNESESVTVKVAVYGRTYLDAELEVPLASLAEGKGKLDVEVRAVLGGFGCNAARALAARLPGRGVRRAG